MTFGPKRECAQPLPSLLKLLETLRSVDRYTPAPQISPEVIRSVPEKFRRPLHKAAPDVACCAVHVARCTLHMCVARCTPVVSYVHRMDQKFSAADPW